MPVMNGIEATKEIRRIERENLDELGLQDGEPATPSAESSSSSTQNPVRAPVIIIALIATSSQGRGVEVLAAGCNDFIAKPVSVPVLRAKIIQWAPREEGDEEAE